MTSAEASAPAKPGTPARERWAPWNDPAAEPHLRIDHVVKRFGEFTAVDDISLDIYKGEFFSLLGPSGCGKTTLLRMLAGFETPSYGRLLLEGEDLSAIPPYRRPVNMMFQSYALFPHMSVEQNVAFGLKQDKVAKPEIARRVGEMLDLVQLTPFAKRRPHQLSGGQRQRVALARSLVKRPKMLLLDEPLGALDKKLREQTQFELMNIQEELGITFVIVTHDQEEAMTVSSRIAVMNHGRIVQVGTPSEIYEFPNSRYVAEFIGDVNILEARVTESAPGLTKLESSEAGCTLTADHNVTTPVGGQAWVALRPEKLEIGLEPPADAATNCTTGEVWDIGYLGKMSVFHVKLASGKMVTSARFNDERTTDQPITWEDKVYLSWTPSCGLLLAG